MKIKSILKVGLIILAVVVIGLVAGLFLGSGDSQGEEYIFRLAKPLFAAELNALDGIEDEAGIAAYFEASTSITLSDVRDVYRTIEVETSSYIIGSVEVPNYLESDDVPLQLLNPANLV